MRSTAAKERGIDGLRADRCRGRAIAVCVTGFTEARKTPECLQRRIVAVRSRSGGGGGRCEKRKIISPRLDAFGRAVGIGATDFANAIAGRPKLPRRTCVTTRL